MLIIYEEAIYKWSRAPGAKGNPVGCETNIQSINLLSNHILYPQPSKVSVNSVLHNQVTLPPSAA